MRECPATRQDGAWSLTASKESLKGNGVGEDIFPALQLPKRMKEVGSTRKQGHPQIVKGDVNLLLKLTNHSPS